MRLTHNIVTVVGISALSVASCRCGPVTGNGSGEPNGMEMNGDQVAATTLDSFDGSGPLVGYTVNNFDALPDVSRVDGRYRAVLTDNTNNVTLHFNEDQGRLDAKLVAFPFDIVVRNIGIGTVADSQTPPPVSGDPYIFSGVQIHHKDLNARDSSHVVVGHRGGGAALTIEGKNTVAGDSEVNDIGAQMVPNGRADIRIVGNQDRTLTVSWQLPNELPGENRDVWIPYRGSGRLPGANPAYGDTVYLGLITYAFGEDGIPFVGTADGIEDLGASQK